MTTAAPPLRPLPGMLVLAIQAQNLPVVKDLLSRDADAADASPGGTTAMYMAVREAGTEFVRALLDAGADVNAPLSRQKETALELAVIMRDEKTAQLLLARGAEIYARDMIGATPLNYASLKGSEGVKKILLDKSLWVEPPVEEPPPPPPLAGMLFWAANHGNADALDELLRCGADPRTDSGAAPRASGETALHQAAGYKSPRMVRALLDAGADVNVRDRNGDTPLMRAIGEWRVETAQLLLERGADIMIADKDGKTAVDYGCRCKSAAIRALMQAAVEMRKHRLTAEKQRGLKKIAQQHPNKRLRL